jgi:hypothetical protein
VIHTTRIVAASACFALFAATPSLAASAVTSSPVRAVQDGAAGAASAAAANSDPIAVRRDLVESGEVAAQLGEHTVTWAELDEVLLARHALGPVANEALQFLAQSALIGHLGSAAGIEITQAAVEARFAELDRRTLESGVEDGLDGHLRRSNVKRADFLHALENQLILAELTRRALGLPTDQPVPEHDQQIWLDQQLAQRPLERIARPWTDGVVARLGEVEIHADQLAVRLRDSLGRERVRDALFQIMLAERVEAASAELPESAKTAAIELELQRRRTETAANPAYQGVSFDALLKAQGIDPEQYHRDPAVRIAALSNLIIDTRYAGAALEATYRAEQEWFDDRFGESIRAYVIFAIAAEKPDGIVRFTPETARARLTELRATLDSEPAFAATAGQLHQDTTNGIAATDLGLVHRADTRLDTEICDVVFALHEKGVTGVSEPVDMSTGVALFYLGAHTPTPDFAGLRDEVHTELRRRFLVDLVPANRLVTYLDPKPLITEASADTSAGGR